MPDWIRRFFGSPITGGCGVVVSSAWDAFWLLGPPVGVDATTRHQYLVWGFFTLLISFGWTFVVQKQKILFYERPKAALVFTGSDPTVFAQPGDVTLPLSDGRHSIRMRQTKYHVGVVNKSGMTLNRL